MAELTPNLGVAVKQTYWRNLFTGSSRAMQRVYDSIEEVGDTAATVLIRGETGTGKELVARAIHDASERRGAYLPMNCAGIPSELLESELFGYKKGAFTGAYKDKPGLFEHANQGTLLLDEIGEMPMTLQTKLLRVLQERNITRVGGHEPIPVDVRIVAATNVDLEEAIKERKFRKDLFYRLNVCPIYLPSLQERREDISALVGNFLSKYSRVYGIKELSISPEAVDVLYRYDWPGNVRELENVMERIVISKRKKPGIITEKEVERIMPGNERGLAQAKNDIIHPYEGKTLDEIRKGAVIYALQRCNHNRNKAARSLGIDIKTIYKYIREHKRKGPSHQMPGAAGDEIRL